MDADSSSSVSDKHTSSKGPSAWGWPWGERRAATGDRLMHDTDGSGIPDHLDNDDDGDGIPDDQEAAVAAAIKSGKMVDSDGDGIPDHIDKDDDGDGIPDDQEAAVAAAIKAGTMKDSDGDGVPDHLDNDDDGDGIPDDQEAAVAAAINVGTVTASVRLSRSVPLVALLAIAGCSLCACLARRLHRQLEMSSRRSSSAKVPKVHWLDPD